MFWKIAFVALFSFVIVAFITGTLRESALLAKSPRALAFLNAISWICRFPRTILDAIERVATRLT